MTNYGVDRSALADCFEHDELRGRSPIRGFSLEERRTIAAALRASPPAQPDLVRALEEISQLKIGVWMEAGISGDDSHRGPSIARKTLASLSAQQGEGK